MKVIGQLNDTGQKDYRIIHEGQEYLCQRDGSKWCIGNQTFPSVKDAKAWVLSLEDAPPAEPKQVNVGYAIPAWEDSVHPCAWIILKLSDEFIFSDPHLVRTLSDWGWIVEGRLDRVTAQRNYERLTSAKS